IYILPLQNMCFCSCIKINHRSGAPERYVFSEYSENDGRRLQMKITLSICFTQMFSQGMEAQYNRNTVVNLARSIP
ncbi:unnamed protein product, partial [Bubo scandiacus]